MKKINLIMPIIASTTTLGVLIPMTSCNQSPKEESIFIYSGGVDSRLGEITYTGGLNRDTTFTFNNMVEGYQLLPSSLIVKHDETLFKIGNKNDPSAECYINEDNNGFTIKALYMKYTEITVIADADEITTDMKSKDDFIAAYTLSRKGFDAVKNVYNHYNAETWTFFPEKSKTGSGSSGGPVKVMGDEGKEYWYCIASYFDFLDNKIGGEEPNDISKRLEDLEPNYDIVYKEGKYSIRYIATVKDKVEMDVTKIEVVYEKSTSVLIGLGKYDKSKSETSYEKNYWLTNFVYSKT